MEARPTASEAALGLLQSTARACIALPRFCWHHQDAEDVVQERFLKLLRHPRDGGDTGYARGHPWCVVNPQ